MKKFILFVLSTTLFLSGCAAQPATVTSSETTTANTVTISSVPSQNPSPKNSAVTTSASVDQEAQTEVGVNQQIQDFLNKEGDFSDENIQQYLINYHGKIKLDLGFVESSNGSIALQGWLFDYTRVGDYLVMAVGFKGSEGINHVKPITVLISWFERPNNKIPFTFEKLGDWKAAGTSHDLIYKTDAESIINTLDLLKGHPLKLGFSTQDSGDMDEISKGVTKLFGEDSIPYYENICGKEKLVEELVSEVTSNETLLTEDPVSYPSNQEIDIPDVSSLDDLKKIDVAKTPVMVFIGSNLIP